MLGALPSLLSSLFLFILLPLSCLWGLILVSIPTLHGALDGYILFRIVYLFVLSPHVAGWALFAKGRMGAI